MTSSNAAAPQFTACPVCDARIEAPVGVMLGEILVCSDCGTELEVVNIKQFAVDEAPMELEDFGE